MIYDRFAAGYDRAIAPFERRFLSAWRRETLALLPDNADILEIGAGTGLNFGFYPPCKHAAASEISLQMLLRAKEKAGPVELLQADAQRLPFGNDSFDAAFATLVFCSLPDPLKAFAELKCVVRPGGRIVLLEHVRPGSILGPVFDVLNLVSVALIEDHLNRRTAKLAADSGLKVVEIRRKAAGIVNLIICEVVK